MVGCHHWLNGHGFGCTPGVGDGQGGLVCCVSWGHKESDMTEWLNWTDTNIVQNFLNASSIVDTILSWDKNRQEVRKFILERQNGYKIIHVILLQCIL